MAISAGFTADVYPWTAEALGSRSVEIVQTTDSIPIEQVAAYRPDLIVATTLYDFDRFRGPLGRIATVVGPTITAAEETWQQTTLRVGEAVGRAGEARQLVSDTEAGISAVRDAHPTWAGRTYTFGPVTPGEQLYTISSTKDPSASLLEQLGLVLSPSVTSLPPSDTENRANISLEQLSLLDADALLLTHFGGDGPRTEFEGQPVFQQIPAVQRGSYVALDGDVAIGLAFPSVLSIPYAVERLTPLLEKALDAG